MSNPSFSNIDRWLFELLEGNLSPEQIAQLETFMLQHPELDADRDVWSHAKIDQKDYIYPNQDKLIRRRPIGLYSAMGFLTITLLTLLALHTNSNSDFLKDSAIAKTQTEFSSKPNVMNEPIDSRKNRMMVKAKESYSSKAAPNGQFNALNEQTNGGLSAVGQLAVNNSSLTPPTNKLFNVNTNNSVNALMQAQPTQLNASVHKLSALKAKLIDVKESVSSDFNASKAAVRFAKTDYKVTLSSRMHKLGRSLQRMLDNPIALRNQRDPYYHVPAMQAMDINFGAVGTMLATRVQTISRVQWLGEENQQLMNQLSIDGYSYGMRGGVGLQMNHSYYGNGGIENYNVNLTYSPKFSVARSVTVEPSIRYKMGSKVLHAENLTPGSLVEFDRANTQGFFTDGSTPMGKQLWYKDLGLGLMVNTKWFHAGIQGDNLFHHYDNIYSNSTVNQRRAGTHFVATIGTDYQSIRKTMTVSPYLVYQQLENLKEAWVGASFRLKWLTIGAAVSSNLEPAASLGLKFEHFAITYNADLTQSQMLNQRSLSHQLTLRFVSKPSRIGQRLLN